MIAPEAVASRQLTLGVIGLGHVGLPLAIEFAKAGFSVWGLDIDRFKIQRIRTGRSPILDIVSADLKALLVQRRLRVTTNSRVLRTCDGVIICVPTPLRKTGDPDISYIAQAVETTTRYLHRGQLVVLESTTYPGTTREFVLPKLTASGLRVGRDFFLAFSPERIDPGNTEYGLHNTPKVVGGITARCRALAEVLYATIVDRVVAVSSTESAEMVKLLENTFRAVNIGLANEVALMCNRLGIEVWEVIDAAATKPFGFMPFYPGPGMGGHCIPVDPQYLAWKMKELHFEPRFIELAGAINAMMPEYVVRRLSDALNERRKPLKGSRVLILGVTYKPNVADIRESPALDVMALLLKRDVRLYYHDPYVPTLNLGAHRFRSIPLRFPFFKGYDACVVTTAHQMFDFPRIARESSLLLDTRNATRGIPGRNIVRL